VLVAPESRRELRADRVNRVDLGVAGFTTRRIGHHYLQRRPRSKEAVTEMRSESQVGDFPRAAHAFLALDGDSVLALALQPVMADLSRVDDILQLLDVEQDPVARADLAQELVHSCSLSEDAFDQALYPELVDDGLEGLSAELRGSGERLREAMVPIFDAVRRTVPLDVHDNDVNFEHELLDLIAAVRLHFADCERELPATVDRLGDLERERLRERLESARRHAIDHPRPPHSGVGRLVAKVNAKLEQLEDTSDQYHPGRERLEQ
jgi:hypothetical protein